ncbi:MAG: class I SAM-dependent methyltransferase [Acidimicrobiia bacterium]|nr:class I SAM-dependent methyltransferase [Acidimicrobiia bacterium]
MGWYRERLLPRVIDKACAAPELGRWRRRAMEGMTGVVVEPGFGSGLNVPHYPDTVTRVWAVDPATYGWTLATARVEASTAAIEHVGLDGETLPLDSDSCDAGLLTFTLCTIPDADGALAELRRVIRPGGTLHYVEHGAAPDASTRRWQGRIEPVHKRLADGCHLTRRMPELIEGAGFEIDWADEAYSRGPKPWSYFYVGRATNPA